MTSPTGAAVSEASKQLEALIKRREKSAQLVDNLPFNDSSVDDLKDAERQALTRHWQRRSRSELRVGRAFSKMVSRLEAVAADRVVVELLKLAAIDERAHSAICHRMAEYYAGRKLPAMTVEEELLPSFNAPNEHLEVALLVSGMCCINESMATAWIRTSLAASTAPIVAQANRIHLRDEIDHARLGWAHLASDAVSDDLREVLGQCLPRLLASNLPLWLKPDPHIPAQGIVGHGQPPHRLVREAMLEAAGSLVLAGFAHVGVPTAAAANWLRSQC